MDAQRALLDSLMGAHRDSDEKLKKSWKDSFVCKDFLAAFCPYKLFEGTRIGLGACSGIHEEHFRRSYEIEATDKVRSKYERRLVGFLREIISTLDAKITADKEKFQIEEGGEEDPDATVTELMPRKEPPALMFSDAQKAKLEEIEEIIEEKKKKMEWYGNKGRVDRAQELLSEVDDLLREKEQLHNKAKVQANWTTRQDRYHTICDICGALLDRKDIQARNYIHLNGRIHKGYAIIRDTIIELEQRENMRNAARERGHKLMEESSESRSVSMLEGHDIADVSDKTRSRSHSMKTRKRSSRRQSKSRSREHRRRRSRSRSRMRRRRRPRPDYRRRSRSMHRTERRRSRSNDRIDRRISRSKFRSEDRKRSRSNRRSSDRKRSGHMSG